MKSEASKCRARWRSMADVVAVAALQCMFAVCVIAQCSGGQSTWGRTSTREGKSELWMSITGEVSHAAAAPIAAAPGRTQAAAAEGTLNCQDTIAHTSHDHFAVGRCAYQCATLRALFEFADTAVCTFVNDSRRGANEPSLPKVLLTAHMLLFKR